MSMERVSGPVYPVPQEVKLSGRTLRADRMAVVVPSGASRRERFAAELFCRWVADEFLVDLPLHEGRAPKGKRPVIIATAATLGRRMPGLRAKLDVPAKKEGYAISVAAKGILAVGRDYNGTLYAVATLMQLLEFRRGELTVRGGTLRDWPYLPIRYVHLYVPGKENIPFFKRYVRDFLLRYKFNGIILEVGGGVRLKSHPEVSTGWRRTFLELYAHGEWMEKTGESCPLGPKNRFQDTTHRGIGAGAYIEQEDLRDIVTFARRHGQEVVPEIQSLSHVYHLACPHREIAELPDALFPDAYCPSNPKSYDLFFDVLDETLEVMKPKNVHIGHDEWRAGGLCPKCRKKDTGRLFAQDVIRIYRHLASKGIGTWMWGDHFVSGHNEKRRSHGRKVWFDYPSTEGAWRKVVKACPDLVLLNWSWGLRRSAEDAPDRWDAELTGKGFRFLYGNFRGLGFENWEERSRKHKVLGAEVSSWCAAEEFELGKMHVPHALSSIPFLWCVHCPPKERIMRKVMSLLPGVRERMAGTWMPPVRVRPARQRTLDLSEHFNSRLKGKGWDLGGLRQGRFTADGLTCRLGKGVIVVRRPRRKGKGGASSVEIPLGRRFAKLVFLQSATAPGRRPWHAGDGTFFPRESSELLGVYDVVFEDGMVLEAEVRYAENVGTWDAGLTGIYYHARSVVAGRLPDGSPLVIWGNEWTNPRPDVAIHAVRFRGAAGASEALPILLGITGIEKVRLSDYRVGSP